MCMSVMSRRTPSLLFITISVRLEVVLKTVVITWSSGVILRAEKCESSGLRYAAMSTVISIRKETEPYQGKGLSIEH